MKLKLKKFRNTFFGIIMFAILFTSCRKFVEIKPSPYVVERTQIFNDSVSATSVVLALYTNLSLGYLDGLNGGITVYPGLSSDEIYPTTGSSTDIQAYTNGINVTDYSAANEIWQKNYFMIYLANDCIEGIENSPRISQSVKKQLVGEAKVMRAFFYFNLVNLFGGVPMVVSTDYNINKTLPRSITDLVYSQIINDLTESITLLGEDYPSQGRARINKYSAMALLAKIYLYQGQWSKSSELASKIIANSQYSLETDLNKVFLNGSREAILQLQPSMPGNETAEGATFLPGSTDILPPYVISDFLLKAFEPGDKRKIDWLSSNSVNGQDYFYPFKYKLAYDGNTNPIEGYMIFRVAEQYLIRAEAKIQIGSIAEGISDINTLRNRSRLPATIDVPNPLPEIPSNLSKDQALEAVAHERQIELFCEWGNRWFDLKRTGQIDKIMPSVATAKGGNWESYKKLYPLGLYTIRDNVNLVENPGY